MGSSLTEKEISILNGIEGYDSIFSFADIIKNKCNHIKNGDNESYIRSYTNDGIVHCTLCGKIIDLKAPGTAIEIIDEIDIDSLTVKDLKSMIEVIKLYCIKPEEYENIYTIIFNASLFLDKIKPICNFITSKFKKDGKFEVTDEFYNNVMEMDNMSNSILSTIRKYNE